VSGWSSARCAAATASPAGSADVAKPAQRRACLALVAPAVASGVVPPGKAAHLAAVWAAFVATGATGPSRILSLSPGRERPRTSEGAAMASEVHRGNELAYPIMSHDAINNRTTDLSGIDWTLTVEPPDGGELFPPDANGDAVFRANPDSDVRTCALELRAEFTDGSETQIFTDSVSVDPDGRVLSMGQGVERPRSEQPAPAPGPTPEPAPAPTDGGDGGDGGGTGPAPGA
jgi:hypothetical protein